MIKQAVAMICLWSAAGGVAGAQRDWQPAQGPLTTRWTEDVTPDKAHAEYPRPHLVRREWQNLNGLWQYAVGAKEGDRPGEFEGEILVPFPIESALSGVMRRVEPSQRLWYRRTFQVPGEWSGRRVRLHFGAVDWETTVWVNGQKVGTHRGGYDPFHFDVTEVLERTGEQELLVAVWDPTDAGPQPRGKQVQEPGGIYYTPTSGIWQTVWLEPVAEAHIESLRIVADIDRGQVRVRAACSGEGAERIEITVTGLSAGDETANIEPLSVSGAADEELVLDIPQPRLWGPGHPWLYDLEVALHATGEKQPVDRVSSYFGMRKVALGKDDQGITRVFFNNEPLFMFGPLDQGFWPDGLYTAPTDDALRYDIELTRDLGFNMCRKHVKVEPARWYYWCDKLGLIVWQDMPSGEKSVRPGEGEIHRKPSSALQFERELEAMIDARHHHPSIVMWVVFNEGWGQYDTVRLTKWVKHYDPTRLVNCASGWNDFPVGDVIDMHRYPGPDAPQPDTDRAAVLGEYGGLGLPVEGHTWLAKDNWGYRSFTTPGALADAYLGLLLPLRGLIGERGLSAAVYTQTTDVETEVNGLLTYDRKLLKIDRDRLAEAHRRLYLPPPTIRPLVATSEQEPQTWRYTTSQPAEEWSGEEFDASSWQSGPGGFGTEETPGSVVRTTWDSAEIWIRREFKLETARIENPHLRVHHDEDAEVYINGVLAANLAGYTTHYVLAPVRPEARDALRQGTNSIAIHCLQTGGGQFIDAGLVDVVEADAE